MKKVLCLFILIIISSFLCSCNNEKDNKTNIKLQIIETDISTNKEKITEEINVKKGELIILHDKNFYECNRKPNDLKILSIEDDYVTISREKLRYENNNETKTYTEKVKENIKYNDKFNTSINEQNPLAGMCSQAKYYYQLRFVK